MKMSSSNGTYVINRTVREPADVSDIFNDVIDILMHKDYPKEMQINLKVKAGRHNESKQ